MNDCCTKACITSGGVWIVKLLILWINYSLFSAVETRLLQVQNYFWMYIMSYVANGIIQNFTHYKNQN